MQNNNVNIFPLYTYEINIFFMYMHFFINIVINVRCILSYTPPIIYTPEYKYLNIGIKTLLSITFIFCTRVL